ncbi:hypothetical protein G9F31_00950 [Acinetobacter sp. 187]|uniref:hypothetical protein n=1 Tax=Acinetobacter lanii TaxID=2715163 RepID=UPI00140C6E2A|nr:hypothetical protein [Acinetobacter lanii]NHC02352.1 hypothetical protein [Acinetobacter lanii]
MKDENDNKTVDWVDQKIKRIICWFSCGAASAVATKIMIQQASKLYPGVELVIANSPIIEEHADNERFFRECQQWFGQEIIKLYNPKYPEGRNSIFEVFKKGYLKGINGAPCTTQLKRIPRGSFQKDGDLHVFGYDITEIDRAETFEERNPSLSVYFPLIESDLAKTDCLAMLQDAGIEIPMMYKLGYLNNNCIGCVKGGAGYWNKIRKDFPETFKKMAEVERDVGHSVLKNDKGPIFLDELDPKMGRYKDEPDIDCSFSCQIAKEDNDWKVVKFAEAV